MAYLPIGGFALGRNVIEDQAGHQLGQRSADRRRQALPGWTLNIRGLGRACEQIELTGDLRSVRHGFVSDRYRRSPMLRSNPYCGPRNPGGRPLPSTVRPARPARPCRQPAPCRPTSPPIARTSTTGWIAAGPPPCRKDCTRRLSGRSSRCDHGHRRAAQPRDATGKVPYAPQSRGCSVMRLYNTERPHTSLDGLTPNEFAARSREDQSRNGFWL